MEHDKLVLGTDLYVLDLEPGVLDARLLRNNSDNSQNNGHL